MKSESRTELIVGTIVFAIINIPLTLMVIIPYMWTYIFAIFLILLVICGLIIMLSKNNNPTTRSAAGLSVYTSIIYYFFLCILVSISPEGPVNLSGLIFLSFLIFPLIIICSIAFSILINRSKF